ncbi:CDP-glycerol glycerophosphotransferase family protein [Listeria costaricensis]|uniref:CDP-glycerol glycerophosphotransferase family protein n=1 Tax=Listeria costaricensis TaxID=2026604 RepID=UPI0013C4D0F5|nr:CDP-glycerol glycerophosphotransferase family protein [Listeria costaricensis]
MNKLLVSLYMLAATLCSKLFRHFKLQTKTVMMISFSDNPEQLFQDMEAEHFTPETIVYYDPRLDSSQFARNFIQMIPLTKKNLVSRLYHLNTAKVVIIDNYFPELASVEWRTDVTCVQIWHADGALKRFAWEDKTVSARSESDQKRFKAVYRSFQHVLVGSDEMTKIFKRSFLIEDDSRFLKLGVPSTDYFFDQEKIEKTRSDYRAKWATGSRKTVLYAPTFRDQELDSPQLLLDVQKAADMLGADYQLLLKLHPAISGNVELPQAKGNILLLDSQLPMKEVLAASDILLTDYSSTPFEFALLKRPIYFFAPDLEKYDKERGLVQGFEKMIPGPVYRSTEELVEAIKKEAADLKKIAHFGQKWNKFADGESGKRLVHYLKDKL